MPYTSAGNNGELVNSLKEASKTLFKRFADNRLRANADYWSLLVIDKQKANVKIGNFCLANSESEKLLGVKFDCKFTFD